MPRSSSVRVIVNPAAGRGEPMLAALHAALTPAGVRYEVTETRERGDAAMLAARADEEGYDAVAVWGGDGTVAEVVGALAGSGVPLVVLPGGTGNGVSGELGLPRDLMGAAALLAGAPSAVRSYDVGVIDGHAFLLRAGVGGIALIDEGATRELKQSLGGLAYVLASLRAIGASSTSLYRIVADGVSHIAEGVSCVIANGGGVGRANLRLAPGVSMEDGLLDALVFTEEHVGSIGSVLRLGRELALGSEPVQHIVGREIRVEADPAQPAVADGEPAGETPVEARVLAGALRMVVPA